MCSQVHVCICVYLRAYMWSLTACTYVYVSEGVCVQSLTTCTVTLAPAPALGC